MNFKKMNFKKRKGFTIVELIVVMAVIGVLVLLAVPKFMGYTHRAKFTHVINNVKNLEDASERFYMDNEYWPRMDTSYFTADELKSYAEAFYNRTGISVDLDINGRYYIVDYSKLSNYVQTSKIKGLYILQNPIGEVYYVSDFQEKGYKKFPQAKDDVLGDSKFKGDITPPSIDNIVIEDKTITILATDNDSKLEYIIKTEKTIPDKKDDDWKSANIITVDNYGTYYVYAKDSKNNISHGSEVVVSDGTKPVIHNVVVEDKIITIEATDNVHVSEYAISLEDSNVDLTWVTNNIITVPSYTTFYIFAKDNVGNISNSYKIDITDNIKPTIKNVIINDKEITIEATDNEDGLIYGISVVNDVETVEKWVTTNTIEVDNYIKYYIFVKDRANNVSDVYEASVVDKILPVINDVTVNDKTITVVATDNIGVVAYGYSTLDNVSSVSIWVTSNIFHAASYGNYYVFAKDNEGNISESYKVTTIDKIVPVINSVSINDKIITISASDNVEISSYGISKTNNISGITSWSNTNIITVNEYTSYYVFAKDSSNNISGSYKIETSDKIVPVINNVTVNDKELTIIATDNVSVANYGISTSSSSSGVLSWGTTNVITAPGYNTYYVFVKDANGNISESYSILIVDKIAPTVTAAAANDKTITISATDNAAVTNYGYSTSNSGSGVSNWGTNKTITVPVYATYYVFAKDAQGNVSNGYSVTTTDKLPPTINSVSVSDNTLTVSAADNVGVTHYGYSTTNSISGVSTWVTSNVLVTPSYGAYFVFAKDAQGNVSNGYSILTVDRLPPTIMKVNTKNKIVTVTATDNLGVTHYGYSTSYISSGVSTWSTSNVLVTPNYGSYFIFAKDAQGNVSDGYGVVTRDNNIPVITDVRIDWRNVYVTATDNSGIECYGYSYSTDPATITWQTDYLYINKRGTFYIFAKDDYGNISEPYEILMQ